MIDDDSVASRTVSGDCGFCDAHVKSHEGCIRSMCQDDKKKEKEKVHQGEKLEE